jgi:hypothetical protein
MAQNLRQSATQTFRPQLSTPQSALAGSVTTQMRGPCRWVTHTTPYLYEKNTCSGEVRVLVR